MAHILELSDKEFKITTSDMTKVPAEMVDDLYDQIYLQNRDGNYETIKEKR